MNVHSKQLHEKLWAAAEHLRASGNLKLNQIAEPVLGLIFLKFAGVRFKKMQNKVVADRSVPYGTRKRPITADDYKSIVRQFRKEDGYTKYKDIKGRCKIGTLKEIQANDYSLNPGPYVEIVEKEMDDVDFEVRMKELMGEFTALTSEAHRLEKKIKEDWGKIL